MLRNKKGQFVKGDPALIGNQFAKGHAPNETSFKKGVSVSPTTQFKKGEMSSKMIGNKNSATGEKHWNWKGGVSKIADLIRTSFAYSLWRKAVFDRDEYKCQTCPQVGGRLSADHIIPFSYLLRKHKIKTIEDSLNCKDLWDINNGRTLCWSCHQLTPTFKGKAKNYVEKIS